MKYLLEYKNYSDKEIEEKYPILFQDNIKVHVLEKFATHLSQSYEYTNYIYTEDIRLIGYKNEYINVGFFNPYKYGRIYLSSDPFDINYNINNENTEYVDNSMIMWGGFVIKDEYQKMNFGRRTIKKLFDVVPELENIIMFAEVNVGKPFWVKLGAEKVLTLKEEEYDNVSQDLLDHMDVFSGDLELFILKREKFVE